jgi:aspartate kinase
LTEGSRPRVLKFGGTSVADAVAVRRLASIVRQQEPPLVVVVSALAGVTDALLAAAERSREGAAAEVERVETALLERHLELANAVADRARRALLAESVRALFEDLHADLAAVGEARDLPPDRIDRVGAYGELLSSRIVASALAGAGLAAAWVDARRVIVTDDTYTRAVPEMEATRRAAARELAPYLGRGYLPVMGGFVGATSDGRTTTLGRGGSDYSAAIVAACLSAREIQIWTDVDGMLTADPRLVEDPRLVSHLSFSQAYELAYFGAKVLHPSTIEPAVAHDIPVRVLNSRRPESTGTIISAAAPPAHSTLTALAGKRQVTVVEIESNRTVGAHEFVRRVLETFERHRTPIVLMTVSDARVSIAVDDTRTLDRVVHDLSAIAGVSCHHELGIVCAVGGRPRVNRTLVADVLGALDGVNLRMVSEPSPGRTVVCVLDQRELQTAMARLHDRFFGDQPAPAPLAYGQGA